MCIVMLLHACIQLFKYSKPRLSRIQVDWGILSELRENPTYPKFVNAKDGKPQTQPENSMREIIELFCTGDVN